MKELDLDLEIFFSKFRCGFRKRYNKQQCLTTLIEKLKSATDRVKSFGALLTDLSNHLMHNVPKWSDTLFKDTLFSDIMH